MLMPHKIVASSRLRELLPTQLSQLCNILDPQNKWKDMAALIHCRNGEPMFNTDCIENIEYRTSRRGQSPSREVITSWYTDNPTVGNLHDIMLSIGSDRAVKYIKVNIFKEPDIIEEISDTFVVEDSADEMMSQPNLRAMPTKPIYSKPCDTQNGFLFAYTMLSEATNGFDERPLSEGGRLLGEGGFGKVYKGLHSDYPEMAVKKFNVSLPEDEPDALKQFITEVSVLSRCNHENLLTLMGYCDESHKYPMCIVYEYMPNGSLEDRLALKFMGTDILPVSQRLQISKEVARGLNYLHNLTPVLIHRDIKSANILLDKNLVAKIGDCGTVREGPRNSKTMTDTVAAVGTMPYMPREYIEDNKVSVKLDSYSYGVVLLEILTSLPVYDREREDSALPTHVRETLRNRRVTDIVDHRAGKWGENLPYKIHDMTTRFMEYKGRRWTISEALPEIESWHVH